MSRRLGIFLSSLAIAAGISAVASEPAEARHRHRSHHVAKFRKHRATVPVPAGGPAFSAIIVDANSGKTLYGRHENELRYPASVTKVMTLYLLFEQLEKGRFSLGSELTVSAHAASQSPSKLGLRPGSTIEVEDAIKAIVTKSANDIAVTVAEAVGGDEETFAAQMTRRAHSLGMSRTVYKNASGLPNAGQVTTAHDLAILGRSIQDRFPKYYRYFSSRVFHFAGNSMRNHNHLLGRVEGMDGIKTGYTAASGFNLLTSVKRDGRHIVGVVLGGRTGAGRDRIMEDLIEDHLESGSKSRTAMAMASNDNDDDDAPAARAETARAEPARQTVSSETLRLGAVRPETGRVETQRIAEPAIRSEGPGLQLGVPPAPVSVERARAEKPRPAYVASTARASGEVDNEKMSVSSIRGQTSASDGSTTRRTPALAASSTATPSMRWTPGAKPVPRPQTEAARTTGKEASATTHVARVEKHSSADQRPAKAGWMIQIGATDTVSKAADLLTRAKGRSRSVASAQGFTEKVQKGQETLYRARFAGLQETGAENACKELKRSGFSCFATRQ